MSRTRLERETSIIFNDEEETASVWTFSPAVQRLLARRGWKASSPQGPYTLPKTSISIRGNRPKRAVSQRTLDALREGRAK